MNIISCRSCNVELNETNWYPSARQKNNRICKKCDVQRTKLWRLNNPDKCKARIDGYNAKYKNYGQNYYKNLSGIKKIKRQQVIYKRRGFGFLPLNEEFKGSSPHHTHLNNNHEEVVFIPKWLHKSIRHSYNNTKTMYLVNSWVLFWLLYGDVNIKPMKLPNWLFL